MNIAIFVDYGVKNINTVNTSGILEHKCLPVTCINFGSFEMLPYESKTKEKTQHYNNLCPCFRTKHAIYSENALSGSFWILQCLMTYLLPSCSSRAHALPTEWTI